MTDFDPSKLPLFWQVLLYVGTLITSVAGYDRYKVYKAGSKEAAAGSDASTGLYESLESSIENHAKQLTESFSQIAELRGQLSATSSIVHKQQIEITQQAVIITQQASIIQRMDGLVDQLRALLVALGHPVPGHIQVEIDLLNETEMKRRRNDRETTEDAR